MVVAEAAAYAGCKEAFRVSADLRARRRGKGAGRPGCWTPAEESVCAALWLRAYLRNRGLAARTRTPASTRWRRLPATGSSTSAPLYDVGAWVHAAAPLLLEPERRSRLFTFVEKFRVGPRRDAGWLFP